ncbi:recombination endonuclease VII [Brevundimonas phage vB_BpoS-MaInes]|nr:recombination endonuclease VII [Brevundimonas phage vB_BpoS-MaInes]
MFTCTGCKREDLGAGQFPYSKGVRLSICLRCREVRQRHRNKMYNKRPYNTAEYRKYVYGLSPEAMQELLEAQDNKCPICVDVLLFDQLFVDHCHDTGQVRGLLHKSCNSGLGFFKDDVQRLQNAINYLQADHSNKPIHMSHRKSLK